MTQPEYEMLSTPEERAEAEAAYEAARQRAAAARLAGLDQDAERHLHGLAEALQGIRADTLGQGEFRDRDARKIFQFGYLQAAVSHVLEDYGLFEGEV